jgi:hypothetical protein
MLSRQACHLILKYVEQEARRFYRACELFELQVTAPRDRRIMRSELRLLKSWDVSALVLGTYDSGTQHSCGSDIKTDDLEMLMLLKNLRKMANEFPVIKGCVHIHRGQYQHHVRCAALINPRCTAPLRGGHWKALAKVCLLLYRPLMTQVHLRGHCCA